MRLQAKMSTRFISKLSIIALNLKQGLKLGIEIPRKDSEDIKNAFQADYRLLANHIEIVDNKLIIKEPNLRKSLKL